MRDIYHLGCDVDANGTCLTVPILRFPTKLGSIPEHILTKLNFYLDYAHVRSQIQLKGFRTWNLELQFNTTERM